MKASDARALNLITKLAEADGALPLNKHPGCWERQLDTRWRIAMNPHPETKATSWGVDVRYCHIYVEFNGWPWAVLTPAGGQVGEGEAANMATFEAALTAALEGAERDRVRIRR